MDFNLTNEQQQFADALRRWIANEYPFEHRKKIIHSESGVSNPAWDAMVELGLTALPIPAAEDGYDGSTIDMMVVMQELGRGLVVEPYFATIMGAEFLKLAGDHNVLLQQVAAGRLKLACALSERQSRHDLFDIATTAKAEAGGFEINGTKTVVAHGGQADNLIVSARVASSPRDVAGISLFVVPADTAGMTCRDYRTIDGQRAADITFENTRVAGSSLVGEAGAGWDIIDAVSDYGAVLLCAEALGAMEALNAGTLDYVKTRQQFGGPIAKFQVLQHRMVDMFMHLEQARSITTLAAVKAGSSDASERRRTASAAKVRVGQAIKYIGQQAIQLHGGMGVTDELPAAHYFKRLSMIELTLGDTDHHLARFASQPGFMPAI